jgi:hypothetical protein
MAATIGTMPSATEQGAPAPPTTAPAARKFKASDLPLPSLTRSAIEGLVHSFKKKGGYDAIRKQVWEKFEASVSTITLSPTSHRAFVSILPFAHLLYDLYLVQPSHPPLYRITKRKSQRISSKSPSKN